MNDPWEWATDSQVVLEMTYTEAEARCNDPLVVGGYVRQCCRPRWHIVRDPRHASDRPLTFW